MGLKWTEILLVLFALILLFGASRLPQLGSSLGSAIRNFKKGFSGENDAEAGNLPPGEGKSIPAPNKVESKQS
jgi:TatA/E family protein of Tat protein translocase